MSKYVPHKSAGDCAAIILAAGYSSRMRDFKPLLPYGDSTIIETLITVFQRTGVQDIIVVAGFRGEKLGPLAEKHHVRIVENEAFHEGMYSSIRTGVKALFPGTKAFFIMPCDIPAITPAVIAGLIRLYSKGQYTVVYPSHEGRKGHPPLISASIVPEILREKPGAGFRELLKRFDRRAGYLEVADEGILKGVNTREEYNKVIRHNKSGDVF